MASTQSQLGNVALSPGLCIQRRAIQRLFKSWNCHKNQAALLHLPGKGHHHMFPPESSPPKKDPTLANYVASPLAQRLCVFPAKLALQCCSQIFTEMRINFQVVSKLNSLYFKNHQNFVLGLHSASPSTLRLLLQSELLSSCGSVFREPMDPNLRTPASTWIDPPGKRVKVKIGSDVGTSLDFLDGRISGLWVDTPDPFARFCLQMPQSEIWFWG